MNKKEKFAYDIDFGAIMDYVENRFMLVIKDEDWTQEEIDMLNSGIDLHFCYTNDIAVFITQELHFNMFYRVNEFFYVAGTVTEC